MCMHERKCMFPVHACMTGSEDPRQCPGHSHKPLEQWVPSDASWDAVLTPGGGRMPVGGIPYWGGNP